MLFVNYFWIEEHVPGVGTEDREVRNPTLEQIMDAISQLDGKSSSYVMFFPGDPDDPDGVFLAVSGGNEGRYVIKHWSGEDGVEHTLIDPTVTSNETVEVIMVHPSDRDVREVLDLATAKKAAHVYATTGKLATDLHWQVE
jgi:hypothetical protein